jgi:hypothetical protein
VSARSKLPEIGGPGAGRTFQAPAGYRDSPEPVLGAGEVVASQYTARREVQRVDTGAMFEAWDMLLERTVLLKLGWRDPGAPSLLPEARRASAVSSDVAAAVYAVGHHRGVEFVAGERLVTTSLREHLRGYASAGARMAVDDVVGLFLRLARSLEAIHGAGFTVGDLSTETIALRGPRRLVFGRFSLGQMPSIGSAGVCLAPEVLNGHANPADPAAAIAIDLYGLGCLGLELALGRAPFEAGSVDALMMAHARTPAPAASEGRSDLPAELADLLAELTVKDPLQRPPTASGVVQQLEIITERVAAGRRGVRVLVVDDDGDRVRSIWSAVRRAHPRSLVDAARDGREAAGKLTRDRPDVVLIDSGLGATNQGMNALELVMFTRGLEESVHATLVVVGEVNARDTAVFAQFGARLIGTPARLGDAVAEIVRAAAAAPRLGAARRTITG